MKANVALLVSSQIDFKHKQSLGTKNVRKYC